jgi:hypothetical protein
MPETIWSELIKTAFIEGCGQRAMMAMDSAREASKQRQKARMTRRNSMS